MFLRKNEENKMTRKNKCGRDEVNIEGICIHKNLAKLTPKQYWLLQHQITSFWHDFGISNGLLVPRDQIVINPFSTKKDNEKFVMIKKEFMRKKLKDHLNWLKSYKRSWCEKSDQHEKRLYPYGIKSFIKDEKVYPSRKLVLEMISLLQDNVKCKRK